MDGPTLEQVNQAIRLLDEHLTTCQDENCGGLEEELRAIHPELALMAQPDYPPDPEDPDG